METTTITFRGSMAIASISLVRLPFQVCALQQTPGKGLGAISYVAPNED
jgi:hypothetical protein